MMTPADWAEVKCFAFVETRLDSALSISHISVTRDECESDLLQGAKVNSPHRTTSQIERFTVPR
jgi:hypothetical protein